MTNLPPSPPSVVQGIINSIPWVNGQSLVTGAAVLSVVSALAYSCSYLSGANVFSALNTFQLNPQFNACTGFVFGNGAAPVTCSPTVGTGQLAPGAIVSNLGFTPRYIVNINDYCTASQISTDITTCGQAAITAASNLAGASYGGAMVLFPAKNAPYILLGTLKITSSFVSLAGDGKQASYISCQNGANDCVQVGQNSGSPIRDNRIYGLGIWGSAKTGGSGVHVQNLYNFLMVDVDLENMIRGFDNDASQSNTNEVVLDHVTISANQTASDYGIYWHAPGDGTHRGDQFTLNDVSVTGQWAAPNLTALGWDGLTQTLNLKHVVLLQAKYGLRITNSTVSTSNFPGFLNADNLQIEGATLRSLSIEGGTDFKISNSDINNSYGVSGQGSGDDYAVGIFPDSAGSVTRGIQITNTRVGINARAGISDGGREVHLTAIQCAAVGQYASGVYPCVDMLATANDLQIAGLRGEEFGGPGKVAYVVQLEAGTTGFNGTNIDGRYVTTGAVNDLGAVQSNYTNLIEPSGFVGPMLNAISGPSSQLQQIYAATTGASVIAGAKYVTGTANSFCQNILNDNAAVPYLQTSCASGVKAYKIGLPPQDTSYVYATPLTGATVTIGDQQDIAVLEPAGTLATLTVVLPTCSALYDGKTSKIATTQTLTALTVNATAGTVLNAPSTLSAGTAVGWKCVGSTSKWYHE